MEIVKINMKKYRLFEDLAQVRSEWRNRINVTHPNIIGLGFYDDVILKMTKVKEINVNIHKWISDNLLMRKNIHL